MLGYFMNDVFTFVVKPLKFCSQQHALDEPVLYTTSSTSLHNYSWQFAIMRRSRIVTGKKTRKRYEPLFFRLRPNIQMCLLLTVTQSSTHAKSDRQHIIIMPSPISSLCWRRSASRRRADRACRPQRSSRFPRSIRSHGHRCSCLG